MTKNIRNAAISRLIDLNYNKETAPAIVDAVLEILSEATPKEITETIILNGKLKINTGMRQVFWDGKEVKLTNVEYSLLVYFAKNAGRVLTVENILCQVWGTPSANVAYIRVYVNGLRSKINSELIKTKTSVGYWMDLEL